MVNLLNDDSSWNGSRSARRVWFRLRFLWWWTAGEFSLFLLSLQDGFFFRLSAYSATRCLISFLNAVRRQKHSNIGGSEWIIRFRTFKYYTLTKKPSFYIYRHREEHLLLIPFLKENALQGSSRIYKAWSSLHIKSTPAVWDLFHAARILQSKELGLSKHFCCFYWNCITNSSAAQRSLMPAKHTKYSKQLHQWTLLKQIKHDVIFTYVFGFIK